jgi:hypothetical protein
MNYELELENIKNWIKNLIIIQYRQSPKNRACIDLLTELIFANCLILKIRDLCLSVEHSEGAQLDVVGKWVSMDRYYNGIDDWQHNYLAYPYFTTIANNAYSTFQGGFSTYTNFADNDGGFLMYKDWKDIRLKKNTFNDGDFRKLIKLKVIKNSINHTKKNIDEAIWKWSNGNVYTTWGKMEVIYNYNSSYRTTMFFANYKNILPHPTGCNITLKEITE